jgi:hypothetical protein
MFTERRTTMIAVALINGVLYGELLITGLVGLLAMAMGVPAGK